MGGGRILQASLLVPALFLSPLCSPAESAPTDEEIARLVRDLGSEEFEARERAFAGLAAAGAKSPEAVLRALPQSPADPETEALCKRLRERIAWERELREALAACGESERKRKIVERLFDEPSAELLQKLAKEAGKDPKPRWLAPAALPFLRSADPDLRRAALRAVARSGSAEAAAKVAPLLETPDAEFRKEILSCLMRLEEKSVAPAILPLLEDADMSLQMVAIQALGALGGPKEAPALVDRLGHPMEIIRLVSAQALGKIRDPGTVPGILRLLESESAEKRWGAVVALYEMKEASAAGAIEKRLGDDSADVRLQAVYGLGALKAQAAAPAIAKRLEDPDPKVRTVAVNTLCGVLKDRSAAPAVAGRLADEDRLVRMNTLGALRGLLGNEALPHFAPLLEGPDGEMASAAARAFAESAGKRWPEKDLVPSARAWWTEHRKACDPASCKFGCSRAKEGK